MLASPARTRRSISAPSKTNLGPSEGGRWEYDPFDRPLPLDPELNPLPLTFRLPRLRERSAELGWSLDLARPAKALTLGESFREQIGRAHV